MPQLGDGFRRHTRERRHQARRGWLGRTLDQASSRRGQAHQDAASVISRSLTADETSASEPRHDRGNRILTGERPRREVVDREAVRGGELAQDEELRVRHAGAVLDCPRGLMQRGDQCPNGLECTHMLLRVGTTTHCAHRALRR